MVRRSTSSRHSRCADKIVKSVEELKLIQAELKEEGGHDEMVERIEAQIEFLQMQANEVNAVWQDILNVIKEDNSENENYNKIQYQ